MKNTLQSKFVAQIAREIKTDQAFTPRSNSVCMIIQKLENSKVVVS